MNVLGATAKLSFDSLAHLNVKEMKEMVKRTSKANPLNLNEQKDQEDTNIPLALNWVIKLLKSIIVKVEEQGDIIRVHNDILANPDDAIDVAKKALDTLKEENEKLKLEIDETRQRGRKGNIIVTCLAREGVTNAVQNEITENGMKRLENDAEMIIRLINERSDVRIPISDVAACHPIGTHGLPGRVRWRP